jgi:osmotically inducible protein OsmC
MILGDLNTYTRTASVSWVGSHEHGQGAITTPSAALIKARYVSGSHLKRRGTNPPELIAAAHASSFSITLADELGAAGYRPRQIDTTATVSMEDIDAGWTMTQIHLDVIATIPEVPQCDFVDAALRAKAKCPISRSLNANISMRARLSAHVPPEGLLHKRIPATQTPGIPQKNRARRNGPKT